MTNPMPLLNCDRCNDQLAQDQIGLCDKCQDDSKPLRMQLLLEAIEAGLTFGDALNAFAERQNPLEKAYCDAARENLAEEGRIEFDDPGCIASVGDDPGAYVLAWVWVDNDLLPEDMRKEEDDAQG